MKFPITDASPIRFSGPLPEAVDLVVIGGGVVGVTTALFAARRGLSVAVLEKGRIAGEQSSRNWGWIRQQGRDPHELPIMVEAHHLWKDLSTQTNEDIGLKTVGISFFARSEKELAEFEAWMPHAAAQGVDTVLLRGAEMRSAFPHLSKAPYAGVLHTPSDLKGEPWRAVPALAGIAAREGVSIHESCAARLLDVEAGRITGVFTEAGRIATNAVVLAGGAWSSLFLQAHGVWMPQLSVRSTVGRTAPLDMPTESTGVDDRFAYRLREDGGVSLAPGGFHEIFIGPDAFRALPKFRTQLMAKPFGARYLPAAPKGYPDAWSTPRRWGGTDESPFERMRILNPRPNMRKLNGAARDLEALYPRVGPVRVDTAWAGMIDVMPDVVPVIDHVPQIKGLIVGTGLSGHGFGIGPGVGRVLADLVCGNAVGHDLGRFRWSRFFDGSPMELGPAL